MAKTGSQTLEEAKKKINNPDYNVFSGNIEKDKNKQTGKNKRRITTSDVINTGSMLIGGPLLGTGAKIGSKLISKVAPKIKKFLKGGDKTKKVTKTTPNKTTKTTKTTKNNKKTKVTPTAVTKPKQGPFPKVYKKPVGPKPKTSTRIKNFVRKNKVPIIAGATALGTGTALLSGNKSDKNKKISKPPEVKLKPKNIKPKVTKPNIIKSKPIKKTNITAGGNTGFGAKGNIFVSSEKRRKELMDKFGGTGSAAARAAMKGTQGNMVKRAAGGLKPVPEGNKGLGKLPSPVRNKMGYMRKGGVVKMRGGGAATKGMNFNRGY